MQHLEFSGAVRPLHSSLGVKRLNANWKIRSRKQNGGWRRARMRLYVGVKSYISFE